MNSFDLNCFAANLERNRQGLPTLVLGLLTILLLTQPGSAQPLTHPTAEAHFRKGWLSELDIVRPADVELAIPHYEKAAEAGHPLAKARIGQLKLGYKLQQRDLSLQICRATTGAVDKYADAGDAFAMYMRGENCDLGVLGDQQKGMALKWYHQAAVKGEPMAQTIVGQSLLEGKGQPYFGNSKPDSESAFSWFQKAYDKGYFYAGAYLAYCHWKGVGTKIAPEKAVELHKRLADKGNARSQALLGRLLLHGEHIPKDLQAAHHYLRKAAEQNDVWGLNALAACLFQGEGVPPNPSEAVRLFRRSAALESADAQATLGACYEEGKGVDKDATTAFSWYLLAARNGNVIAQTRVGVFYMQGIGCTKNRASGLAWLRLAAKNGDKKAVEIADYIEKLLREQELFNQEMDEQIASLQRQEETLIRDAERYQQVRNGERRSHNGMTIKDLRGY